MSRRPRRLGSSCYVEVVERPTTDEIRRALLSPDKEAAYQVDADRLIYGDEVCVRESPLYYSGDERWMIHNHPPVVGGLPIPSQGDCCTADAKNVIRFDIVGLGLRDPSGEVEIDVEPEDPRAEPVVVSYFNRRRVWPCPDYINPHGPCSFVGQSDPAAFDDLRIQAMPVEEHPIFIGRKAVQAFTDRMTAMQEKMRPAPAPTRDRFAKLEIDGARRVVRKSPRRRVVSRQRTLAAAPRRGLFRAWL